MEGKYVLACVGIGGIAAMETAAIATGLDGQYLSVCVGTIAGIVGAIAGISIKTASK